MKVKRVGFKPGYTQDGYVGFGSGRIVLYEGHALVTYNPSMDHNALMRAFASRYGYDAHEIINNSIRLYFTIENGDMLVSECRKIDYDIFTQNTKKNLQIIAEHIS